MKPIIKVENVSKQYRIGAPQASYQTLRDSMADAVKNPFKRLRRQMNSRQETIWALKDVSFVIEPGEVVGFLGRNGAGKSTLLKILSRITEPTAGRIELYGRIGSLLEVGTGFHPELSGRENVYLNGAILGMGRAEIERKFDAIVDFSEIEKFIDTPVKWYSSGMYLRLAFAVAAHMEPEVLVLDEILAVGDASFQMKCFNKIEDIRNKGCTILFVSHNMQTITRLCKRAIYLSHGTVMDDGPAHVVASAYLSSRMQKAAERIWDDPATRPGNEVARLRAVRVRTKDGRITETFDIRHSVGVEMEFDVLQCGQVLVPTIAFYNEENVLAFLTHDMDEEWRRRPRPTGRYVSTVWVPGNFFAEGLLNIGVAVSTFNPLAQHLYHGEAVTIQIIDTLEGDSARGDYTGSVPGVVRPLLPWTTQFRAESATASLPLVQEVTL